MKARFFYLTILVAVVVTVFSLGMVWAEEAQPAPEYQQWSGIFRPGATSNAGHYDDFVADYELDMTLPVWQSRGGLLFLNPRIRFNTEHGSNEFNFGLGYRRLLSNESAIVGINAYYDTMKSPYYKRYNQFGFGIEVLSMYVDLRSNVYLPFGKTMYTVKRWSDDYYNYSLKEEALDGFDAELGVLIPYVSDAVETHVYFGGYWYDSDLVDNLDGWKARIEMRPGKIIVLGYEYRKDNERHGDTFYTASLEIPFSLEDLAHGRNPFGGLREALKGKGGPRALRERMNEKVIRDRHITTITGLEKNLKEVICTPNESQERACEIGRGNETRTCNDAGNGWSAWDTSACEVVCTPNESQQRPCEVGTGDETRTCNETGTGWSDWDTAACVVQECGNCILSDTDHGYVCQGDNLITPNCNSIEEPHICASPTQIAAGNCTNP